MCMTNLKMLKTTGTEDRLFRETYEQIVTSKRQAIKGIEQRCSVTARLACGTSFFSEVLCLVSWACLAACTA